MARILVLLFAILLSVPAFASDEQTDAPAAAQAAPEKQDNPYLDQISTAVEGFREKNLNNDQAKTLYEIKQAHGIVQSVRAVNRDVSAAVDACGTNNPGLKDDMSTRYQKWWKNIQPVTDQTEKKMNDAIDQQDFLPAGDIRNYLDLIVKAADFTESQYPKTPITTEDACKSLLKSMDNTEQTLMTLLDGIEISQPGSDDAPSDDGSAQ